MPKPQQYPRRWTNAALRFRAEHPLCIGCKAIGIVKASECVDHIVPHVGNPDLMWRYENLQPACSWHHDVVKQHLEHLFERGQCSVDDLRLDSAKAIEITKRKQRSFGVDGWPTQ